MKYQALVEERLRHCDLVSSLCEDLLASVRSSLEIAEQMQRSDLKVLGMQKLCAQNLRDIRVHSRHPKGIIGLRADMWPTVESSSDLLLAY